MRFTLDKNIDYLPADELENLQVDLLKKHLRYTLANSPFYKDKFSEKDIASISKLSDLSKFTKTSKKDLADCNSDFLSISKRDVVEYVTTSGTTGKPVSIALSKNDLDRLAYNEARSLEIADFTADDTVQITTTLDKCFMAGMAYYLGLTKIGAAVIRAGQGTPEFHWEMIKQINPTALIAVPSFLQKLGANSSSIQHQITKALCIGEPLRNADFSDNQLTKNIAEHWHLDLRSTYASTEMATAFTECQEKQGGHLLPELIILEILDVNGNEVADGELGEVTVTPLGIEAMPLVRFQTGDLARKHSKTCACGRITPRLGPIEGRLAQMIKLKGTTIYPTQIEEVLHLHPTASPYLIEIDQDENGLDSVSIILPETCTEAESNSLLIDLQAKLRVKPNLKISSISAIQKLLFRGNSRKPKKIIDNRNA
ncbi:phenylacetate--CoA ligase family protein [Algoriphagus aquimarinus]|uniref:Phenylacetate-CoA ligase n=1 Tax=Algoriphagus aquimarinus TaxID=237018 RepID=A0A1I0Y040_9BACT|nr:AMP-binding protein [Algoriphagus aquimarinus]SFB05838.1 phenylacetate-CoA ligase [Algoriphagus aquimarinus]